MNSCLSKVKCVVSAFKALMPILLLSSCDDYFKNDYYDNSPTSGKLKVYYDEGLRSHVRNQALTFESQYERASVELVEASENKAVEALYNDSCELIIISRMLGEQEKKVFASKNYTPSAVAIAISGIAVIANSQIPVNLLSYEEILALVSGNNTANVKDSTGEKLSCRILFDKNNSSVLHYMVDSVLHSKNLSQDVSILESTIDCINYVASTKNTIAFIDFAWLSDADDSLFKANRNLIKFIGIGKKSSGNYEFPHQSSFKLANYPFTRTVYAIRKTGDFTLAKGFQSYLAGPKGQLTFLKQGLLPARQGERRIQVVTDAENNE